MTETALSATPVTTYFFSGSLDMLGISSGEFCTRTLARRRSEGQQKLEFCRDVLLAEAFAVTDILGGMAGNTRIEPAWQPVGLSTTRSLC
jgi:hypothetical protein